MEKYSFDSNNLMLPCMIYKSDLARIYDVSLRQLRRELCTHITLNHKHRFTAAEVKRIFEILGTPTRWDVEKLNNKV